MIRHLFVFSILIIFQQSKKRSTQDIDLLGDDQLVIRFNTDNKEEEILYYYDQKEQTIFINNTDKSLMKVKSAGNNLYGKSRIIYLKGNDNNSKEIIINNLSLELNLKQTSLSGFIESCL